MRFRDTAAPSTDQIVQDPQLTELSEKLTELHSDSAYPAEQISDVIAAIGSCDFYQQTEFGIRHDHFRLIGQDNWRRYRPVAEVRVRVDPADTFFEVFARACAARAVGSRVTISTPPGEMTLAIKTLENLTVSWAGDIEFVEETDDQLADVIRAGQTERIRYASTDRVPPVIRQTVADTGIYIADRPVMKCGRIELLWYLTEQSLSVNYHRYGNLGDRADEERAEPL